MFCDAPEEAFSAVVYIRSLLFDDKNRRRSESSRLFELRQIKLFEINMASNLDHLSLAWTGDYDALKKSFSEDIKLEGIWEQPGDN